MHYSLLNNFLLSLNSIFFKYLSCWWIVPHTATWTKLRGNCKHEIRILASFLALIPPFDKRLQALPAPATAAGLRPLHVQQFPLVQQPGAHRTEEKKWLIGLKHVLLQRWLCWWKWTHIWWAGAEGICWDKEEHHLPPCLLRAEQEHNIYNYSGVQFYFSIYKPKICHLNFILNRHGVGEGYFIWIPKKTIMVPLHTMKEQI